MGKAEKKPQTSRLSWQKFLNVFQKYKTLLTLSYLKPEPCYVSFVGNVTTVPSFCLNNFEIK